MKHWIAMILCCLLLTGCGKAPAETAAPTEPDPIPMETNASGYALTLYAPNEDATGFICSTWEISELRPSAICDALIEAGVLREDSRFNSIQAEGSQVTLDVNTAFGQYIASFGTAGEYTILGSVVNTLLAAYNAETVLITVDGQVLESGHAIYDAPLGFYENY